MTALAYCTVIGKFADLVVDGADGGADPDAAPLVGQVTLTCDARDLGDNPTTARLLLPTETPPRTITIEPFPVTLDGTGSFSAEVVATGQTGVTVPSVFTYTASFALKTATGAKVRIPSFSFAAPAGATVDLALVAPAVTENGINYIVGPQGPPGPAGPPGSGGGGGAGLPANILTKNAAFTAAAGDFILANGGGGGFPITLPLSPAVGALVVVKKTDGTTSTITVLPSGSGTIDGDANATIVSPQFGGVFEHVGSNAWELVAPTSAGGSNGTNGNTVLNGTGAPSSSVGVNGDFYVNTTAHTLYGPKASGAWPGSPLSLVGPAGSNGTNGAISTVQDEGSALTVRPTINFVGAGAAATDDAANNRTLVTIPGASAAAVGGWYGDGSDGAFTADGTTAMPGANLSGSTYTLTRNMYLTDLTVNSGVTIKTNGWILSASGTLTNNGSIHNNGGIAGAGAGTATGGSQGADGSGTGNTGGSAGAGLCWLGFGKQGGLANSSAGTAAPQSLGGSGGNGGSASGGATAGGSGGASSNTVNDGSRFVQLATQGVFSATNAIGGGGGGGGAANDGANQGGGGGGGGNFCLVNAKVVVNNGTIRARGGAGANAVAGNSGGGGGGGGGVLFINTTAYSGSGTFDANGGAGGAKAGTGVAGSAGSNGTARLNVWS